MRSSSPSEVPRPREVRRQHRALGPRGEPVRRPAPSSFFVLFHGRARRCVDVSYAGNRGRGGMTGPVAGIRRRRTVAGRRETPHLPPDRDFYGQTLLSVSKNRRNEWLIPIERGCVKRKGKTVGFTHAGWYKCILKE